MSMFVLCVAVYPVAARAPEITGKALIEWLHRPQPKIVLEDRIWRCAGQACSGPADNGNAAKLRLCRSLATRAGRILMFETSTGALDAESLARCNRGL